MNEQDNSPAGAGCTTTAASWVIHALCASGGTSGTGDRTVRGASGAGGAGWAAVAGHGHSFQILVSPAAIYGSLKSVRFHVRRQMSGY